MTSSHSESSSDKSSLLPTPRHNHHFSSPNSPNEPSSPNSTFDGGQYFLETEARRNEWGTIDVDHEIQKGLGEKHTVEARGKEDEADVGEREVFGEDELIMVDADGSERRQTAWSGEEPGRNEGREDGKVLVGKTEVEEKTSLQVLPHERRRGIRFAPLRVPLSRRLQTLAVLFHITALTLLSLLFYSLTLNPLLWPLIIIYLLHLLFSNSHHNGLSPYIRSPFLRTLKLWRWYNKYFPIRIHRTVKLDPECNYIFGYSPHGIISFGAWGAFVTESSAPAAGLDGAEDTKTVEGELDILNKAAQLTARPGYKRALGGGFKRLFPGITTTLLTLDGNFRIPIYREYLLAMGLASVSRQSCEALLGIPASSSNSSSSPPSSKSNSSQLVAEKYPVLAYHSNLQDKTLYRLPKDSHKTLFRSYSSSLKITVPRQNLERCLSFLNPLSWLNFFFHFLLAFLIPAIPAPFLERYLKKRHPHISNHAAPPKKGGHSITIVLGGARESLLARPGHLDIILRRRQGFIKLALRSNMNGTPTAIVPCLAFGENDVYSTLTPEKKDGKEPWLVRMQMFIKKTLGFTVPVFWARGVFNYDVGLVPFRERIEVVVGRPVFPRGGWKERREEEVVKEMAQEYEEELRRIWDEWKRVFAPKRKGELEVVG